MPGLTPNAYFIYDNYNNFYEVDPKTVGQFVGQYKGKNIFVGDIVKVTETDGWKSTYEGVVVYDQKNSRFAVNSGCQMIPITGEKQTDQIGMGGYCEYYYQYEVIGNEYEPKDKCNELLDGSPMHLEDVAFWGVDNKDTSNP